MAAVVVLVVLVVVIVVQTHRTSTPDTAATPAGTVDGGTAVPVGQDAAPVVLDVYEDFQCPICAEFEATVGGTVDGLVSGGQAVVRYHPIAFLDRASTSEYSTRALNAAAVVLDRAGKDAFARLHDLLFAHQPAEGSAGLSDDQLIQYAGQAGATGAEVADGIRNREFEDWTKKVTDASSKAGITGTPTVLVDGTVLDSTQLTPDGLTAAVSAAAAG